MKLYKRMKKRAAKKLLGNKRWHKLLNGISLYEGDLVHTCQGYNDHIREIFPIRKGRIIVDFDVETINCSCSLYHCLTFPLPTKDEIISYWMYLIVNPQFLRNVNNYSSHIQWLVKELQNGKDPFNENGTLKSVA